MKTRYRIVKLRNGMFARQWRAWLMPWEFVYGLSGNVRQFDTIEEAEHWGESDTDVVEVVKEL